MHDVLSANGAVRFQARCYVSVLPRKAVAVGKLSGNGMASPSVA
jgi:hypothetical protein